MLSLTAFAAEMERDRARLRTHDALMRKAKSGHVTGNLVFGYTNRPVLDGTRRSHVERVVEPREAAVVRRIFALAAEASSGSPRPSIPSTLRLRYHVAPAGCAAEHHPACGKCFIVSFTVA